MRVRTPALTGSAATGLARACALALGALAALCGCDGSATGYQRGWAGAWTYGGAAFAPADPATFQPLSPHFGRDARQGYCRGSAVEGSEGATFEALSEHEARDGRAVYYCSTYRKAQEYWAYQHLRIATIPGADAASFEPLSPRFARDAQRGYFEHADIPGSHGASFALMDEDDPGYARDRAHAWHGHIEVNQPNRGPHPVLRPLQGADMATLRALGRGYAADARRVWYQGEPLARADAASFRVLTEATAEVDAHDRAQAWQRGRAVAGNDPGPSPGVR